MSSDIPHETPSPDHEAMQRLGEAIDKAINYHVAEYNLTYDQVIGGLEIIKATLLRELLEDVATNDDDEEQDD